MEFYRFDLLGADSRPIDRQDHLCRDDLDALEIARALAREMPVEVWNGARRVAHVNAGDVDHTARQTQSG